VGRKKRIPDEAEGTTVYLTPEEQIVLRAIVAKRKKRLHQRASINEVMVDALWGLAETEAITKKKLNAFLADKRGGKSLRV